MAIVVERNLSTPRGARWGKYVGRSEVSVD